MIKILSRLKLTAESWFDALNEEQKKVYLEEHPDSKYAKNFKGGKAKKELPDTSFEYNQEDLKDYDENHLSKKYLKKKYGDEDLGGDQHRPFSSLFAIKKALDNPNYTPEYKEKLRNAYSERRKDLIKKMSFQRQAEKNFWDAVDSKLAQLTKEQKSKLREAQEFDETHPNARFSRLERLMQQYDLPAIRYTKKYKDHQFGGRRGYYVPNFRSDLDLRYHYDSIPSRETMEETRNFVDKELGRNSTNLL